ncbi:MAG: cyclase [Steroidobacteraceae bacterium]
MIMAIHHKVADYTKWRAAYDAHEQARVAAGVTNGKVYQSKDDRNDVVILFDVSDVSKAKTFSQSQDLKSRMQEGGVLGQPEILFQPQ